MDPNDLFDEANLTPGPNEFDPAASLNGLLEQAYENPAYRPELFRRMLLEQLFVLVAEEIDFSEAEDGMVPLSPLRFADGELPVFTSLEQLKANPAYHHWPYAGMKGRELLGLLPDVDYLVNCFNEPSLRLSPALRKRLLAGESTLRMEVAPIEDEEVVVMLPEHDDYPNDLVAALQTVLSGQPRVRAAYLLCVTQSSLGRPRFAVYLEVEGAFDQVAKEVGEVASYFVTAPGMKVNVLQAQPNVHNLMDYVLSTPPIYVRD